VRILHIVADGRPGGGTTNVLALVEDLRSRGLDHVNLVTQAGSYALERARALGAGVFGVDFFRSRFNPRVPYKLDRIVEKVAPSVVHVHGARAGFYFGFTTRRTRFASAYTVRGYHFLLKPTPLRHLAAAGERLASSRTDSTVHVCHYDRELAAKWKLVPSNKRQVVIHNGIHPEDIPLARRSDPKLVAFLGRLTYQKDPLLVVEVARLLTPEGFRFRLIGGGDLEDEVRAAITRAGLEQSVEVLGSVSRERALQELRDAGTFLLPSRWEGLPIAPVEAMQMGLPVVVSDVSGMPEVVDDGRAGIIVRERTAEAFAAAVRSLAFSPALRAELVERGRRMVQTNFTRQRVTRDYLRLYEELLGGQGDA
jgi:glycosyltransferase involved in cell wall biosynthesis